MLRASAYLHVGNMDNAKRDLGAILQKDPDHEAARKLHRKIKNYQKALDQGKEFETARSFPQATSSPDLARPRPTSTDLARPRSISSDLARSRLPLGSAGAPSPLPSTPPPHGAIRPPSRALCILLTGGAPAASPGPREVHQGVGALRAAADDADAAGGAVPLLLQGAQGQGGGGLLQASARRRPRRPRDPLPLGRRQGAQRGARPRLDLSFRSPRARPQCTIASLAPPHSTAISPRSRGRRSTRRCSCSRRRSAATRAMGSCTRRSKTSSARSRTRARSTITRRDCTAPRTDLAGLVDDLDLRPISPRRCSG